MIKRFFVFIFAIFISIICVGTVSAEEVECVVNDACDINKTYTIVFKDGEITRINSADGYRLYDGDKGYPETFVHPKTSKECPTKAYLYGNGGCGVTKLSDKPSVFECVVSDAHDLNASWTIQYKDGLIRKITNNDGSGWQVYGENDIQPESFVHPTSPEECPKKAYYYRAPTKIAAQPADDAFYSSGCQSFKTKEKCDTSKAQIGTACVWKSLGEDDSGNDIGFCSTSDLTYVSCGDAIDIPSEVPRISSLAVTILKTGAAIILIIMGTLTLLKAIYSSKEDEIKKAQSSFIKKLIAAALIFFVVSIVQFIVLKVADTDSGGEDAGLEACLSCFLNDDCKSVTYYKNVDAGDNETCFKVPTTANVTPKEITCPALPSD